MGAYGTLQSYRQLEIAVSNFKKPEVVVLAYAFFHDERNTGSLSWKRSISTNQHGMPYARLDRNSNLSFFKYDSIHYTFWPMSKYSSFVNYLQVKTEHFIDKTIHSHEVSKKLIQKFQELCTKNNIKLVIAIIHKSHKTNRFLKFCKSNNILCTDISVDINEKGKSNVPYDIHPSALAHKEYAEKLFTYLVSITALNRS